MEKYTPGPWEIEKSGQYNQIGNRLIIRAEKPEVNLWDQVCEVGIIHTGLMGGSPEANARLIAAAPDIVTLLDQINTCLNDGLKIEQGDPIHKLIKNTIFKAVGA